MNEFDWGTLLIIYCAFSYAWTWPERNKLLRFMVSNLDTAPRGTTITHCKVFSWAAYLCSPLWFAYWMVKLISRL